jgi:hypothetical protein
MSTEETIFTSRMREVDIPIISLPGFVLERMGKFGDKPAVIDSATGNHIKYRELATMIKQVSIFILDDKFLNNGSGNFVFIVAMVLYALNNFFNNIQNIFCHLFLCLRVGKVHQQFG